MIYFDNAATTKPDRLALDIFNSINNEKYFNISAGYSPSFLLSKENEAAKERLIKLLDGDGNLIFTSGATESNNLAIFGSCFNKNKKYLFSIGEHPSVYNSALELKNRGYNVLFVPLQNNGQVDYNELEKIIDEDTCFVSTMFVNNETGAINDLKRIRQIIDSKNKDCVFHVDAVQGFCKIKFSCADCKINLCSISSHKINGLKGIGALYISKKTKLKNINFGGGQENNLRSGTVNVAGNISFSEIAKISYDNLDNNYKHVQELKTKLIDKIKEGNLKDTIIVSYGENFSPYVLTLLFKNKRGETIMRFLSNENILVGTGSACSTNKVGNRNLENMGYNKNEIIGAIRISFGKQNTLSEVDEFFEKLKNCLKKLDY